MASACAARAPKQLEAPVMPMMFFIGVLLGRSGGLRGCMWLRANGVGFLCEAAVRAKHLRVDPSAIGPGKERDGACDIVWLTEAFEWRQAADLFDLLFGLAVQEELRTYRSRCNGVDGNFV